MTKIKHQLLAEGVSEGIFPGAVALIGNTQQIIDHQAQGLRMVEPQKRPMRLDTIFDLASLTKPIVVGTLTMQLVKQGQLDLFASVSTYLPEIQHQQIRLLDLLTHTSGYPAWRALYPQADDAVDGSTHTPAQVVEYLGDMPLDYETGSKVVYSCLGYILMGKLIERVTAQPLAQLAQAQIFQPLGMNDTCYNPPPGWQSRCAATETLENAQVRRGESFQRQDWWHQVLVGTVHDENAHYLGGISGNAGLFSTTKDLSLYCQAILKEDPEVLSADSTAEMAKLRTAGLNANRSIGWIVLKDRALYHSGFTGTALRLDLERREYQILLTNRGHPSAADNRIPASRDQFSEF